MRQSVSREGPQPHINKCSDFVTSSQLSAHLHLLASERIVWLFTSGEICQHLMTTINFDYFYSLGEAVKEEGKETFGKI